jgi:hypothetical protein
LRGAFMSTLRPSVDTTACSAVGSNRYRATQAT